MTFRHATDEHGDWLCTDMQKWPCTWKEENFVTEHYTHRTRQALLRMESGWDISVIWGTASYSDNYHFMLSKEPFHEEVALAEVALLHHARGLQGGDVLGYVKEEDFAHLVNVVMRLPSCWDGDIHDLIELEKSIQEGATNE